MNTTKSKMYAGLAGASLLLSATAFPAAADMLLPAGVYFDMYTLPDNSLDLQEEKVYVNQDTTVAPNEDLTGSIGANDGAVEAYWTTTDAGGLVGLNGQGNGFAVIKGGGDDGLLHDVTFGVYDSVFEDVIFSLIPAIQTEVAFTVTGYFQDGSFEARDLTTANGLENWLALAKDSSNLFTEINIHSDLGYTIVGQCEVGDEECVNNGGFTEAKQWQVSGVTAVPLPAAVWLFGSALLGMAGIGYRRSNEA